MMDDVYVFNDKNLFYPDKDSAFSPSAVYPEYRWTKDACGISEKDNAIYRGIREIFHNMNFDHENYNTRYWNPLADIVCPGSTVLIKPNMVKHQNDTPGNGTECLYTHPSLVRAVVDYVLIAQKGKGRVMIADAPVQSCDFKTLYTDSGYGSMVDFYDRQGIKIEFYDLRKEIAHIQQGIVVRNENKGACDDVCIDLAGDSSFCSLNEEQLKRLRVTDYSPDVMNRHHTGNKHEYSVSGIVLEADVIINMPKIKTHRLGGITAALKNMVGINSRKDYLPHHRMGDISEGGDQFRHGDSGRKLLNRLSDIRNRFINEKQYQKARIADVTYRCIWKIFRSGKSKDASIGNWYGNDTIWRTVSDLNKIVLFADKAGNICKTRQRNMIVIGDMVVSGEGEGPLNPQAVKTDCVVFGDNPLLFDMAIAKLMGYTYDRLPVIRNNFLMKKEYRNRMIHSNNECYDGKKVDELSGIHVFKRPQGWEEA